MNKQIDQFVSPKFKMTYNNDLMNCFYEKSSYSEDDLYQILKAIQHKKKFVLLKDDRIIDLENEDAKLFKSVVEEMDLNPKHLYTEEHEPLYKTLKIINICHNFCICNFMPIHFTLYSIYFFITACNCIFYSIFNICNFFY